MHACTYTRSKEQYNIYIFILFTDTQYDSDKNAMYVNFPRTILVKTHRLQSDNLKVCLKKNIL